MTTSADFPSPAGPRIAGAGSTAVATTPAAASFSSGTSAAAVPTRRVVDAPTRAFHWLLALSFIGAYLSADGERWRLVHVTLGYGMVLLLAFRIVWGFAGARPARWAALKGRLGGLTGWLASLREIWAKPSENGVDAAAPTIKKIASQGLSGAARVNWTQGQNLALALTVVVLLLLLAPLTASGLVVYNEWAGEWAEDVHEWFGNAMLVLVLAHVALVAGISLIRRRNLLAPMISGRVAGPGPDLVKRNHLWLGAALLAAVLALWGWQWQNAPQDAAGAVIEQVLTGQPHTGPKALPGESRHQTGKTRQSGLGHDGKRHDHDDD